MLTNKPIAILGAGAWGTALAIVLANNGHTVYLWGHDSKHMRTLAQTRYNAHYLAEIKLPDTIIATADLEPCLKAVEDVLIVVPSYAFKEIIVRIKPLLSTHARLVWGTKGLDAQSSQLLHLIVDEILGNDIAKAVIAGPSFAKEVALGLPTAVTIASNDKQFAEDLVHYFNNNHFRAYTSSDIIGVEISGAVKNVLAIAAGIIDGLQLGANALSALITRGLAEMIRLGTKLGAQQSTFIGLAGVGDIVLTCSNNQSRNRRFGIAIAVGKTPAQAMQELGQVVEGLNNLQSVYALAKKHKVEMPITECVYDIIYKSLSPQLAIASLFMRKPKDEQD